MNAGPMSLVESAARHAYKQLAQVAAAVRETSAEPEILGPIRRRFIRSPSVVKVLIFAGAGTSVELGVPGMVGLATEFREHSQQWSVEPDLVKQIMGK